MVYYLLFLVQSGSTLFAVLSSLIRAYISSSLFMVKVYTVILRNSPIRDYTICHSQQSDQGLHYLPFPAFWSGSTLLAILSSLINVCTVIISSLFRVYTICHSQQSDQFQAQLSFSGTVWTGSTLFAILSSLIRVYTVCHSQHSDQGLHCLPFSAAWIESTLFSILSLIRLYTICHTQQSDHTFLSGLLMSALFAILSSLIRVYSINHSQQSDQGLHCHSQQSDQGLHYLPFAAVW